MIEVSVRFPMTERSLRLQFLAGAARGKGPGNTVLGQDPRSDWFLGAPDAEMFVYWDIFRTCLLHFIDSNLKRGCMKKQGVYTNLMLDEFCFFGVFAFKNERMRAQRTELSRPSLV